MANTTFTRELADEELGNVTGGTATPAGTPGQEINNRPKPTRDGPEGQQPQLVTLDMGR